MSLEVKSNSQANSDWNELYSVFSLLSGTVSLLFIVAPTDSFLQLAYNHGKHWFCLQKQFWIWLDTSDNLNYWNITMSWYFNKIPIFDTLVLQYFTTTSSPLDHLPTTIIWTKKRISGKDKHLLKTFSLKLTELIRIDNSLTNFCLGNH